MIIELTGGDERLEDYTSLTDVALRRSLETRRGLYMAESTKVITRAVAAGHLFLIFNCYLMISNCFPTSVKASIALSICSLECAADS